MHTRRIAWLSALSLAITGTALASPHPAGEVIENAAIIDLTAEGLAAVGDIVPAFVPDNIPLDTLSDEYEGLWDQCYLGGYAYSLSNAWVAMSVEDVALIPEDGYLDLDIHLLVWINDGSDPFDLMTEVECVSSTCEGYVEPFNTYASTTISLDVVTGADGNPVLDATVGELTVDYDLSSDQINLDSCGLGSIEDVLNFFGLSMYDLILDLAAGQLESAVADFGPQIEEALEDAFAQATIDQQLDLNGVVVDLELYPSEIETTTTGVRVAMNGVMDAETAAECIAQYDPGVSEGSEGDAPALGISPAGVDDHYHIAMLLSDDIGNQALYALWRGGLLCYEITEEAVGMSIDTSMLGLLAGSSFDELFPESQPMAIVTRPEISPTMNYATDHDAAMHIEDLGLDFFGELDNRQALILGMGITGDIGVDLELDDTTGQLAIAIDMGADALHATVTDNEFEPDASADIEDNFAGVLETLLGSLAGGALDSLVFDLPAFEGVGLTALQVAPTGSNNDWLGAYAWIGPVNYGAEGGGCGGDSGDSGCSGGGCATAGSSGGRLALLALFPMALALLRRRRD